jgi:uncharacterized repeat protein (TIGR03837 family)
VAPRRWDIFCTVVDNFGDIGVCWRLARQLADEFNLDVRLWVDDLASFARICPEINPALDQQSVAGVDIRHWSPDFPDTKSADVVIEAFACTLPDLYVAAMREAKPVWINLEYLSAEDWVEGCHGLSSPQSGLAKYFFFPGFTERTGGVPGETAMRRARGAWSCLEAEAFLARFAILNPSALKISLFAYENPAIASLIAGLANGVRPVHLYLPESRALPEVAAALGYELHAGVTGGLGSLTLTVLPMLAQDDYDRLLWSCDLNFVRGEDSFVRAQWAAHPFVWHIYPQEENAHFDKLDAFMARYLGNLDPETAAVLAGFSQNWNHGIHLDVAGLLEKLPELQEHAQVWSARLAERGDLVSNLVKFASGKVE